MPKIKIFTAKNVQQYGFTDREIEALNAEWELKAAGLGLEEHLPEYWQEAKRHMNEKLAGRAAESDAQSGPGQPDAEPIELPSLDVSLDDLDMGEEEEITAIELPDEEFEVEFLSDELSGMEPIAGDELEIIPEEQPVALAEMAEESAASEGLAWEEEEAAAELTITVEELVQEEEPAGEPAAAGEPEPQVEEAAPEQVITVAEMAEEEEPVPEQPATAAEPELELEEVVYEQTVAVEEKAEEEKPAEEAATAAEPEPREEATPEQVAAVAEMVEEIAAEEKIVPAAEPEFEPADTAGMPETAAEELAQEEVVGEEPAPVAERKKESFFEKIMARLKKILQG